MEAASIATSISTEDLSSGPAWRRRWPRRSACRRLGQRRPGFGRPATAQVGGVHHRTRRRWARVRGRSERVGGMSGAAVRQRAWGGRAACRRARGLSRRAPVALPPTCTRASPRGVEHEPAALREVGPRGAHPLEDRRLTDATTTRCRSSAHQLGARGADGRVRRIDGRCSPRRRRRRRVPRRRGRAAAGEGGTASATGSVLRPTEESRSIALRAHASSVGPPPSAPSPPSPLPPSPPSPPSSSAIDSRTRGRRDGATNRPVLWPRGSGAASRTAERAAARWPASCRQWGR